MDVTTKDAKFTKVENFLIFVTSFLSDLRGFRDLRGEQNLGITLRDGTLDHDH
jgi:hypothetical protein